MSDNKVRKPDKNPSAHATNLQGNECETFFKADGTIDYEIITERNPDKSIKRVYRKEPKRIGR